MYTYADETAKLVLCNRLLDELISHTRVIDLEGPLLVPSLLTHHDNKSSECLTVSHIAIDNNINT